MKKVKIALTAVTVLAVIGGALAFKSSKVISPLLYFYDGPDTDVFCDDAFVGYVNDPSGAQVGWYYASLPAAPCPYIGRLKENPL